MNTIKVFGHKAPDTDTTCSAIVWAWYLNNHLGDSAEPYVLGEVNTETKFVLEYWGINQPKILDVVTSEDFVAVVDTNNTDELFENINDTTIVSIVDHHKLTGGLRTDTPRRILIEPYASTITVMYDVMNIEPKDFPREIAGIMLSGLLSDTLAFRSPTTTEKDKELAEELAQVLNIDIEDYSAEMFKAKSDISHLSDSEIIRLDSKIYDIQNKKMRISVIETTNPDIVLSRKEGIIASIHDICKEDSIEDIMVFVIDILKEEATLLVQNDTIRELAEKTFNATINNNNTILLPGIVSRKKQIIPMLSK